ncbi:MAG: hypothetical protein U5L75_00555 [Candidatus Campbellbacteria bacterium]|nr:hypothetical protein [Candidatus Campbellbacteria bacterium]
MDCLAINIGSSSKKYLLENREGEFISMTIEKRESGYFLSMDHGERSTVERKCVLSLLLIIFLKYSTNVNSKEKI